MTESERIDKLRTALFDTHILPCPACELDGWLDWHDGNYPKPIEQIDVRCDCGVCGPLAWTSSGAIARWNMPLWRKWRTEILDRPRTDLDNDGWLQTITGEPFWLVGARPIEFDIRVIAWSLSMQPRFNGHQRRFFSIAHHSLIWHPSRITVKRAADLRPTSMANGFTAALVARALNPKRTR